MVSKLKGGDVFASLLQDFILATERAVPGRSAHLWIYDRKSKDNSGFKLALDRQPNDIVMYDARRQLSLDCESKS